MFYPTWKISKNWSVSGAIQSMSRAYFYNNFRRRAWRRDGVLQAQLMYSQIRKDRSFVFRAGELSSAFGSFLLRYDDAVNPLIDMPLSYGYYQNGVTTAGLAGAQVDATWVSWTCGPIREFIAGKSPTVSSTKSNMATGPEALDTPFLKDFAWESLPIMALISTVSLSIISRENPRHGICPPPLTALTPNGAGDHGTLMRNYSNFNSIIT